MKKIIFALGTVALLSACSSIQKTAIVPTNPKTDFEDTYTIIWNGKSEAYMYENGEYVRNETYDYVFSVIQKRYDNVWKSTKTLHRNHPNYDYRGGQRSQTMYFRVTYAMNMDSTLSSKFHTSLGEGKGTSDIEFRKQNLVIDLNQKNPYYNISKFTPFNKMKITQNYNYEEGILTETVELYKEKDGKITPFSKMEETAYFYVKGKLDKAPSKFQYTKGEQ